MRFLIFSFIILFTVDLPAQNIRVFRAKEDSLKIYSSRIINDAALKGRIEADSMFTRVLVRSLKMPNSFNYKFDSLTTLSIIYPPDNSFRLFTWQLAVSENMVRQHGAIQMKTIDGSLKLFPLIDKSDRILSSGDTITSKDAWLGAIYYKIIETTAGNKKLYTLLGFDANNFRSDKKIIEVLHFENGQPVFGGNFFDVPPLAANSTFKPARIIIEFKKDASPRLMYDEEEKIIVLEHLISESNDEKKKYTLVPDGDFHGFAWKNGKWVFQNKVFTTVPSETPPVPLPFTGTKGLERQQ